MRSVADAMTLVARAWPTIVEECRAVLGGELHYQAVVYHCLRGVGVPRAQLGMNVKQWITDPVSTLFQAWDVRKDERFRGGFEPIPDVVLFAPGIQGDWRRRNFEASLRHMLVAIEVKASERAAGRLSVKEITRDIEKLAAHRDEAEHRGCAMHPVMMVIDTAPLSAERMTEIAIGSASRVAEDHHVSFFYVSPTESVWRRAD